MAVRGCGGRKSYAEHGGRMMERCVVLMTAAAHDGEREVPLIVSVGLMGSFPHQRAAESRTNGSCPGKACPLLTFTAPLLMSSNNRTMNCSSETKR